jgi:serine/threonine-protein kinase
VGDPDLNADSWARISLLLDEVLELPEERRARWLEALGPGDARYRGALERLLEAHAQAQRSRFLDTLPKIDAALLDDGLRPRGPVEFSEGMEIGPYRLERELGRGGMGTVWIAQRTDGSLKRSVALKLPRPGAWSRAFLERFNRERDILAGLTHPHIARLYDAGFAEDGQPFLALELIEGEPITTYCDTRRLDVRRRVRLFLQVLDAVQHAHRNLVIHRDLKPSNILVAADGGAMLLDFGIAKLLAAEGEEAPSTELTELGGRALTPEFASPEQIAGSPITTASDIYSLGVLLCELLCGHRPYRLARGSRAALEEAILAGDPAPPSRLAGAEDAAQRATTPRRLAQALEGDLDTIVHKTLKKSPAERYASADALARDLDRYLKGEPVEARPDSRLYRVSKFVSRHRAGVVTAAAVMLAIVGSLAFALVQMRAATRQRNAALFEARRAEASKELTTSLLGEARQDPGNTGIQERLEKSRRLLRLQFVADPAIRAELLFDIAERYGEVRDLTKMAEVLDEIEAIARGIDAPSLRARHRCAKVLLMINEGKYDVAESLVKEGFAELRRDSQPGFLATAECLFADADLASVLGDLDRGIRRGLEATRLHEERGLTNTQSYANAWNCLTAAYSFAGDVKNALRSVRREREIHARLGRDGTFTYVWTLFQEATFLNRGGRRLEALARSEEALAQSRAHGFPDNHAMVLSRAVILLGMGRPKDALSVFDAAAPQFASHEYRFHELQSHVLAAEALIDLGDARAARRRLDPHWRVIEEQIAAGSTTMTKALRVRAQLLRAEGRLSEAWEAIVRALTIIAESNSPTYTGAGSIFRVAAEIALARGDLEAAQDYVARAQERARRDAVNETQSADIGEVLLTRARILSALGRSEEASRDAAAARGHLEATVPPTHPLVHQAKELARLLERSGS